MAGEVGNCCFGEEGTPLPLAWDTATGAVRRLDLPAQFQYGTATGVSGGIVIGRADFTPFIWTSTRARPSSRRRPKATSRRSRCGP